MKETSLYKAHKLHDMLKSEAWSIYEGFINAYICEYIASSVPREQLIGMKQAISEVKKFTIEMINCKDTENC